MEFIQIGERCINMEAVAFVKWDDAEPSLQIYFNGENFPLALKGSEATEAWTHFRLAAGTVDSTPFDEMQEALKKGGE